jgi:hypothetical protein
MARITYMHAVMNSNNILSLGILLLGLIVVVITLGIVQMAKAGLVNDNSVMGFAGQSKNIQRTAIAVEVVNTPTSRTTTLNPTPKSTIQGNLPAAAEVASSIPNTTPLDCNGAFEKIPLVFRQTTLEKIQDCVTITGKVTFTHYYSPDGDAIVNVYPDPQFLHLMGPANTRAPFVGHYPGPGGIHSEIPCQVNPKATKAYQGDYCKGANKALWPHIPTRPKVSDHVKVTGTLATDRNELGGITEIHPVTDIQIISASGGAAAQSHYQTGYNDGCAGNVVSGPHTSDYNRGYAEGQAACSRGGSNSGGGDHGDVDSGG